MSATGSDEAALSADMVFEILSNTRRRMVLYYLRHHDEPISVQDLAAEIAALENDMSVSELSHQQKKRVYVSLYQTHLPKLEESGIIEYNDEDLITLAQGATQIDTYLTGSEGSEYPWYRVYLALAIVGGVLFGFSLAGIPGVSAVPPSLFAIALLGGFFLIGMAQYWANRQRTEDVPAELGQEFEY